MFCPHCGHQQVSTETRFCSRCGLPLGLVSDLLNVNQLQREKRELTGIALIMATVLMLMNFIIVFGVTTLPHLENRVFLWIWIGFVLSSLIIGGFGLANLIRAGFFSRLKQREAQLNFMKSEQKHAILPEEAKSAGSDIPVPRFDEPVSVTEVTTRELDASPNQRDFS